MVSDIIDSPFSGVRVIHHNVQGLLSKISEISHWLHDHDREHIAFCCSETWLKTFSIMPSISGFELFCSPALSRPSTSGILPGSAIFVSSLLRPEHPVICDTVERSCSVLNVACCITACKFHRVVIVSIYRSPSTPFNDFFTDFYRVLSDLSSYVNSIIVAGDFNIDLISDSSMKTRYMNILSDFNLVQHIDGPSRVCHSSSSLIDHVSSSCHLTVTQSIQAIDVSDHYLQLVDFDIPTLSRFPLDLYGFDPLESVIGIN